MRLLGIMGKIAACSVVLTVTIVQLLLVFLFRKSSFVFNLLASLFIMGGLVVLILGVTSVTNVLKLILVGFLVFLIPVTGQTLTEILGMLREKMCDYLRS